MTELDPEALCQVTGGLFGGRLLGGGGGLFGGGGRLFNGGLFSRLRGGNSIGSNIGTGTPERSSGGTEVASAAEPSRSTASQQAPVRASGGCGT
jgi:hypothetical protein